MMIKIKTAWGRFMDAEEGATAVEYGLIAGLISVGLLLLVNSVTADNLNTIFNKAADGITDGKFDNSHQSAD